MGFVAGDTEAPGMKHGQRIHSQDQCSDLNVLPWFVYLAITATLRADAPATMDTEYPSEDITSTLSQAYPSLGNTPYLPHWKLEDVPNLVM